MNPACEDIKGIRGLVENTFPYENSEFYDFFFSETICEIDCFYRKYKGKISSVLFSIPATIKAEDKEIQGRYFYALATDVSARGNGLMTELIEEAEKESKKEGAQFFVLVPSEESLFDFYGKRGYRPFCKKRVVSFDNETLSCIAEIEKITLEKYGAMRRSFFEGVSIVQPLKSIENILLRNASFGYNFYKCDGSVFMLEESDEPYVAEFCGSLENANVVAKSILTRFGKNKIDIPVFDVNGKTNVAMIKSDSIETENLFMTYILD